MVLQFFKSNYAKLKSALGKARSLFGEKIKKLFQGEINEETLEQLEQLLYEADFGVHTASELTHKIRTLHQSNRSSHLDDYLASLRAHLLTLMTRQATGLIDLPPDQHPLIILIVGVNGNGKTTSVAKLAHLLQQNQRKVLVAAADTFRAAATEQLDTWAQRLGIDIVKGTPQSDPAAIAFDAIQAAQARRCDVVLIDTAGRLHTKVPLMQELEKIKRACAKSSKNGPHETLLVLDATTGQNAIDQAKQFHQFTPLTGIILTKLDGTAKGGIAIAIQRELGLPIKFIGTGEQLEDLQPFDPSLFLANLLD